MIRVFLILLSVILFSCGSQDNSKEELKRRSDKHYSREELKDKSLEELRKIRNEIFARHGYIFNSKDLAKYFKTKDWYEPKHEDVDSLLTKTDKKNINLIVGIEKEIRQKMIPFDKTLLRKYRNIKDSVKVHDDFMSKLLKTIDQFKNRIPDTTVYIIGNIDDNGTRDTIATRVFKKRDTIYVQSSWIRKNKLMWTESIKNPYMWIDDDDLFQFDTRSQWVTFTIGIYYAPPELNDKSDYSAIKKEEALQMGFNWIKRKDLQITEADYRGYFEKFNGQILEHGNPVIRHELLIWCEPIKAFVLYYAP
jgi:hypothetical protein